MTHLWKSRKVLVLGLGRTGVALCRYFLRQGACVSATDIRSENEIGNVTQELRSQGAELYLGGHDEKLFLASDVIALSPGVPPDIPALCAARKAGVPITGETEIASCMVPDGRIIAVTGTNGKSTTVHLIARMLERAGQTCMLCGNVGTPFIAAVEDHKADPKPPAWWVLEVSSFQLETARHFHPRIAVLLNVTADHLDRYESFDAYHKTKERLFAKQGGGDLAVLNADEGEKLRLTELPIGRVECFSMSAREDTAAWVEGETIFLRDSLSGTPVKFLALSETRLFGFHNLQNLMAAALAAREAGVPLRSAASAARDFPGLPHVMTRVAEIEGVLFYDNSKATNVDATVKSLAPFDAGSVALILGGRDKGGDYGPLWRAAKSKVKRFILIGENREALRAQLHAVESGQSEVLVCESLEEAVVRGASGLCTGDVLLLAPAASSFDMFRNYRERGDVFQKAVLKLHKGVGQ